MKITLAFLFDEVFKAFIIFFISLVFYRATGLKFIPSLIFSVITAIVICVLIYVIKIKQDNKKNIKASELQKVLEIKEQLSFASTAEINNYIKSLLSAEFNYKKELTLDDGKTIIKPIFYKETFDFNDLKQLYRENKNRKINKIIVLCFSYTGECRETIKSFKNIEYEIKDINEFYTQFIKPQNILPNFKLEKLPKEKLSFTKFKAYAFSKPKSKTYFFCGLILLFSSYFVPLRIYYLIFSGLMFISALLCITFNIKKEN